LSKGFSHEIKPIKRLFQRIEPKFFILDIFLNAFMLETLKKMSYIATALGGHFAEAQ
jgi:hypothetical protein